MGMKTSQVSNRKYGRNAALLLVIAILMSTVCFAYPGSACAAQNVSENINVPQGFEKIAQTGNLALFCNPKTAAIAVEDKSNGYIWRSVVDKDVYDINSANQQWKSNMASMLEISYVDKAKAGNIIKANSDGHVKDIRITDGKLTTVFDFNEAGIIIELEIKLENDSLVIRVPADKIQEKDKYLLTNIELLPFLGAADHKVDGYILYPDGSGALTRYGNTTKRPKNVTAFKWSIYGPEQVNLSGFRQAQTEQKYQAMLPVYGIKNGNNAILAAACDGEEDTDIKLYPEGLGVNLNRILFSFNYRHFYNINLSNITVNGKNTAKTPVGTKVDKDIIGKNREVRIFFLSGKDANYSGMANVYREYLIKNNLIKNVIKGNDKIPMGVDLFMGIKEEKLLFDKYISMTTFENAVTISEELIKEGVENMQVMLKGWTKGGYGLYPVNWPPDSKLGGSRGLMTYSQYAENNGIQLYLQNDFTQAYKENGGFSQRTDVVLQGSKLPVTNQGKNYFLLNPFKSLERLKNFFLQINDYGKTSVAFENIGRIIYHDYNKSNPSSRENTKDRWEDMMYTVSNTQNPVAVEGGNQYVLKFADRLYNIPVKSSDYYITDESVPFYQMVVHGMVPYTSEPANLSYDLKSHKLKWVEYGCMPYFELTYKKSVSLRDTEYNKLFTSYYGDWYKKAAEINKEFNTRLKSIWSEQMTGHDRLEKNLYSVSYGNGTVIYINYDKKDIKYNGYTIKAQDYLVLDKGGIIK